MKIGVDIVEIERMIANQDRLAEYLLSSQELTVYYGKNGVNQLNYLASRFAVKEALVKALNDKSLLFKDISVLNSESGAPYVCYKQHRIQVSISHERHYVVAMVVVEE